MRGLGTMPYTQSFSILEIENRLGSFSSPEKIDYEAGNEKPKLLEESQVFDGNSHHDGQSDGTQNREELEIERIILKLLLATKQKPSKCENGVQDKRNNDSDYPKNE